MAHKNHPGKRSSGTTSTNGRGLRLVDVIYLVFLTLRRALNVTVLVIGWCGTFPAVNALKTYTCPECNRPIPLGTAHLVVWQKAIHWGVLRH